MTPQGQIVLRVAAVDQLVMSNPPSPFPAPRLRKEAEDFIVECATDLPRTSTATLLVCLPASEAAGATRVADAVRQHFSYRRARAERKLRRVRQLGWRTMLIGLVFFSVTLMLVQLMKRFLPAGSVFSAVEGGLTILAWVALWRPGELLLYEWHPFRREARLAGRLEHAEIQFLSDVPPA